MVTEVKEIPEFPILIFGGRSDERLVSVASAQGVSQSFEFREIWFVSEEGRIFYIEKEELQRHKNPFTEPFRPQRVGDLKSSETSLEAAFAALSQRAATAKVCFFLAFHGTDGEDGTVQELLEQRHFAFTGSGSKSSRLCFDKAKSKACVKKMGLAVASELKLTVESDGRWSDEMIAELTQFHTRFGKIVLKPIANGSSIGLFVVDSVMSLRQALQNIQDRRLGSYLAEAFIEGRELTVGVLDGEGGLTSLPPSEVVILSGGSFDYEGKYLGKGSKEITPAVLTAEETRRAQEVAQRAHQSLGCEGYSRTDMIYNGNEFFFLETNTLPGLTAASFIPQQLAASGRKLSDFVAHQLKLAVGRQLRVRAVKDY